jgi:hypothetical protein
VRMVLSGPEFEQFKDMRQSKNASHQRKSGSTGGPKVFESSPVVETGIKSSPDGLIDMSGRKCSICGSDNPKFFDKTNGRPRWQKIEGEFACHNCHERERRHHRMNK